MPYTQKSMAAILARFSAPLFLSHYEVRLEIRKGILQRAKFSPEVIYRRTLKACLRYWQSSLITSLV